MFQLSATGTREGVKSKVLDTKPAPDPKPASAEQPKPQAAAKGASSKGAAAQVQAQAKAAPEPDEAAIKAFLLSEIDALPAEFNGCQVDVIAVKQGTGSRVVQITLQPVQLAM